MKRTFVVVFMLLSVMALAIPVAAQKVMARPEFIEPVFDLKTPRDGQILKGGSVVTISWELSVDKAISDSPWSEMELFLADDNGLFTRITPQLGIMAKSFEWTVPRLNTRSARIVLQFGIEGEGDFYLLRQIGSFKIVTKSGGPSILLNSLSHGPRAGEDMQISWTSEMIDRSRGFDVMISYDRGAHFFKAGTTTESVFTLPVEDDFAGAITIKINGVGTDGSKVSTLLTPEATFRVKSKEQ
jgi:hypothetical protein